MSNSARSSRKRNASAFEPRSTVTIVPPAVIWRFARSCCGCDGRCGYPVWRTPSWCSSRSAIVSALDDAASTRRRSVSRPLTSAHALNGLRLGPVWRVNGMRWSVLYWSVPRIAPPRTRPWPSMCLVAEYTTTSAPSSSGFCSTGLANTLSTTTIAPAAWASSLTALRSTISSPGFEGVSRKTMRVGRANAACHWSRSPPSTSTVSTPQRGRISVRMTLHEPKSARPATIRSPAETTEAREANTAAMPLAVAMQASAPSSRRSRSSNIVTVGLP